ncbi:MAG: TrmH family RNA methyltransferase [Candidatus Paceibacterota bacterium]|jgi:tRNA G18 (ribose-2'-O)-methylase SpoU
MQKVVILNNIRSNENVGSIFRTCDAVGVTKIILVGYTPTPVDRFGRENKGLTKASLGAEKNIEWEKVESLEEAISSLKNNLVRSQLPSKSRSQDYFSDCLVVGIEQDSEAIDYKKIKDLKTENLVLVFGNEVEGLSKEDLKICDVVAQLPMLGQKESLNVAVCAGVVLYSLV